MKTSGSYVKPQTKRLSLSHCHRVPNGKTLENHPETPGEKKEHTKMKMKQRKMKKELQ